MNLIWFRHLILLAFALVLHSCLIADEFFLSEPTPPEPTLQQKSESAVQRYIQQKLTKESYKAYGFSEIVIHQPKELKTLDSLLAKEAELKKIKAPVDSALTNRIANQKELIKLYGIKRWIDIDHFFTLKYEANKLVIIESNYIFNDTLGVTSFKPSILLETTTKYEEAFNYYFYEYSIFLSPNYRDARALSNNFYEFFKRHQNNLADIISKSEFLQHCLKMTLSVKETGEFNLQKIVEKEIVDFNTNGKDSIAEYESRRFSVVYEKSEEQSVTGYYIFHKFIGRMDGVIDEFVMRVDFNPYYQIEKITLMPKPYETYFNN